MNRTLKRKICNEASKVNLDIKDDYEILATS